MSEMPKIITWIRDVSGGGFHKLPVTTVMYTLPFGEAVQMFEREFKRSIYSVTCDCCGPDFFYQEYNEPEDIHWLLKQSRKVTDIKYTID